MTSPIVTWLMPMSELRSNVFALEAGDTKVPVWLGRVREATHQPDEKAGLGSAFNSLTEWCSFARFDAQFPAEATVYVKRPFGKAEIHPRSTGATAQVEGDTIKLAIPRAAHLTLLLDGRDEHPLHLFCRQPEAANDLPRPDDATVIYFGPGEHWVNTIRPKSGQTVYIDGGAIVRAVMPAGIQGKRGGGVLNLLNYPLPPVIDVRQVENVRVCGRGVVDGTLIPHPGSSLVGVARSSNIRIEGITLRNSPNWHLPIAESQDVTVENVACLSGRLNSDGINCVSSSRVVVRDCFARTYDDSYMVKAMNPQRPSTDILYERCVAWNDWGYAFGVSYETRADIHDVAFRDCDVVFARNWPIGIMVADSGTISKMLFERLGIEYPASSFDPGMGRVLVRMQITANAWGKDAARGHVRDITLRDIDVRGQNIPRVELDGCDAEHAIEDVTLQNVRINGSALASAEDHLIRRNGYVRDSR